MKACWIIFQLLWKLLWTSDTFLISLVPRAHSLLSLPQVALVREKENERAWKQSCFGSSFPLIYSLL